MYIPSVGIHVFESAGPSLGVRFVAIGMGMGRLRVGAACQTRLGVANSRQHAKQTPGLSITMKCRCLMDTGSDP